MILSINRSSFVPHRKGKQMKWTGTAVFRFMFILFILSSEQDIFEPKSIFVAATSPVNLSEFQQNEDSDTKLSAALKRKSPQTSSLPLHPQSQGDSTKLTLNQILIKAGKRGIGGGIPGAIAGAIQVITLMWLRTIINYQYRYGVSFKMALTTLFKEGGIPRFYRGLWFALIQAPLSRFASTAANDGVESFLSSFKRTRDWGPGRGTILASFAVGLFRIFLMPIDTCKIVLQVDSAEGLRNLMRKVRGGKINLLYSGAMAQASSAIIAHYPWFYTYNFLSKKVVLKNVIKSPLLRNATIGFLASLVSDVISNSIRVIKITKQALSAKHSVGYGDAISMVLAADGWKGLFGRGLKTRIIANGFQSIVFTVIWRGLSQHFRGGNDKGESKANDSETMQSNDSKDLTKKDYVDDIDSYSSEE